MSATAQTISETAHPPRLGLTLTVPSPQMNQLMIHAKIKIPTSLSVLSYYRSPSWAYVGNLTPSYRRRSSGSSRRRSVFPNP